MQATTIANLSVSALDLPLTEPFGIASGAQASAANVLVRLTLEDGTVGLGEAAPFPAVSGETQSQTIADVERLATALLGQDSRSWRRLALGLRDAAPQAPAACCAIEMALLDALTQHYGVPLHTWWGGFGTVLETDMTITTGDVEHAARSAKAILERGISTIKVKIGSGDFDADEARIRAIAAVAPNSPLILDGNCGYDVRQAMVLIQSLRSVGIHPALLEQPLPREDWEGMTHLTQASGVLIAADESARSAADVVRLAQLGAAHVVNIKLMKCGIVEALRMINCAQSAGLELMIGGMVESLLAMTFSAHLAAGIGGFRFVDLDTPMFIAAHPFTGGFVQAGSTLSLDATPGHGVRLR